MLRRVDPGGESEFSECGGRREGQSGRGFPGKDASVEVACHEAIATAGFGGVEGFIGLGQKEVRAVIAREAAAGGAD